LLAAQEGRHVLWFPALGWNWSGFEQYTNKAPYDFIPILDVFAGHEANVGFR
jgi:hypothetical protein